MAVPASILSAIEHEGGRVAFARFMELALTEPAAGYYTTNETVIGRRGDFTTAPERSRAFPVYLSRILRQLVAGFFRVAPGRPPLILELGAGGGDLSAGILAEWQAEEPGLRDRLLYRTLDVSPVLRRQQEERLAPYRELGWDVRVLEELSSLDFPGVAFSNELVDALPVHLLRVERDLREVWVEPDERGELHQVLAEPTEAALEEAELLFGSVEAEVLSGHSRDGWIELRPALAGLMERLSGALGSDACLLTIDYGEWLAGPQLGETAGPEAGLAAPPPGVPHGRSVRAYFKHQRMADLTALAGKQDLTADVDFRALDLHGSRYGFHRLLLTSLAAFLASLGAREDLEAGRREQRDSYDFGRDIQLCTLAALLDENDVGGLFKVMIQVRET